MRVIRAEVMGLCFGVRDALEVVEGIDEPATVTIHGQLVHNEVVQGGSPRRFRDADEAQRGTSLPETPTVLITAHGISDRERGRLEAEGKRLIDTTCPLVPRVHQAARTLAGGGLSRPGDRPEGPCRGRGDHRRPGRFRRDRVGRGRRRLSASPAGDRLPDDDDRASRRAIRAAIVARNPDAEVRFVDTVCLPTKEHQRALDRLLDRVEAVVVVGGRNSNNTRELAARCRERGKPALHVQSADELDAGWFKGFATVGLTAGTSTLPETIEEVHRALVWIGSGPDGSRRIARGTPEPAAFLALEAEVAHE